MAVREPVPAEPVEQDFTRAHVHGGPGRVNDQLHLVNGSFAGRSTHVRSPIEGWERGTGLTVNGTAAGTGRHRARRGMPTGTRVDGAAGREPGPSGFGRGKY